MSILRQLLRQQAKRLPWALSLPACKYQPTSALGIHQNKLVFHSAQLQSVPVRHTSADACHTSAQQHQDQPPTKITMKIIPAVCPKKETYSDRNERLGRFLSPALSIYKIQITSLMSISLRMSGLALTLYTWVIGVGGLLSSHDIQDYVDIVQGFDMSSTTLTAIKFMIALPFVYHYLNGLRHLSWYTGALLAKPQIYMTGYITILATLLTTLFLATLTLGDDTTPPPPPPPPAENVQPSMEPKVEQTPEQTPGQPRVCPQPSTK